MEEEFINKAEAALARAFDNSGAMGIKYKASAIVKFSASHYDGVFGNMSQVFTETLQKEYRDYLLDVEIIQMGFKLVCYVMIATGRRIVEFDKQGATV